MRRTEVTEVVKTIGIHEASYYRWREELEKENARLLRGASALTLNKMNLQETIRKSFLFLPSTVFEDACLYAVCVRLGVTERRVCRDLGMYRMTLLGPS